STHTPFPIAIGLSLGLLLSGCGGSGEPAVTVPATDTVPQGDQVLRVGGRLFSVPSPIQSALAVRDAGLAYQRDALMSLEKGAGLTGRTEQALALGIYGADMAYATAHEDGQRTLATLQAIERLSASLELSNAFDKALLDRFRDNLSNEDRLLRFSGAAFRAADEYLKTNERDDVSALVLAGGWLEALHLSLADPKAGASKAIVDRVGEQITTLDGLVELLSSFDGDDRTKALVAGLKELQAEFKGISIQYTFEPPVTDREARTTFINSTTSVSIAADQLSTIAAKVAAIRSSLFV
ncbi:MAG: hypothetical protein WEC15_03915, partial [Flavobacteriales bacterium]